MAMTGKETVLATLRHEPTERRAAALLSGGLWTLRNQGLTLEQALNLPPERFADILAESNEHVRSDIVWTASGFHNLIVRALGGRIEFRDDGAPEVVEPPLGQSDFGQGLDLCGLTTDPAIATLAATTRHLVSTIGKTTLVGSSQWAPFTLAGILYGEERLKHNLDRNKQEVHAVLDFAAEACSRFLERFVAAGSELVSLADPAASGDMISRQQFEEFALPALTLVAQRLRAQGVLVCVHICGDITDRLDCFPDLGASFLSVDSKVDLAKVRAVLGSRLAFSGNLDPVSMMQDATPDAVAGASRACFEKVGQVPGYILMPGCDIPPNVPLANIQAMMAQARDEPCEGKYLALSIRP
jgi:uroporphyrinogen decarboxylase